MAITSLPCARALTCSKDNLFPSMLVDEWALRIIASRLKVTSHFGIKGELRIVSLAEDIRVSNLTILFVYVNLG
jgi:hypothetical protein